MPDRNHANRMHRKGRETVVFGKEVAKALNHGRKYILEANNWVTAQATRLGVPEATIHDAIARGIYAHQIERIGSALVLRMEMAERSTHMRAPPSQLRFDRPPR